MTGEETEPKRNPYILLLVMLGVLALGLTLGTISKIIEWFEGLFDD